jgi:hypothetical protein
MTNAKINQNIADFLTTRQNRLKVTTTTTTPGGHVVDWVPIESQTKDKIAAPPTASRPSGSQDAKTPTRQVTLDEPAAGPAGHVPMWRPDISRIPATASLENLLSPPYSNGYMIFTCTPRNPFVESVH